MTDVSPGDSGTAAPPAPPAPRLRARRVNAQATRDRRRRLVTWGLSVTLGVLAVSAVVGDSGYLASLRARREQRALLAEVASVRQENERLRDQRVRITSDPGALEEEARRQLQFIRDGETLVIIRETVPSTPAPTR
jgi:cell division protein FtsB